jgi:DNA-binding transcriptional LysR family regulator
MNEQSIRPLLQCDIKLLVAFSLLVQEKHVTKAAIKQGISQPPMSLLLLRLESFLTMIY